MFPSQPPYVPTAELSRYRVVVLRPGQPTRELSVAVLATGLSALLALPLSAFLIAAAPRANAGPDAAPIEATVHNRWGTAASVASLPFARGSSPVPSARPRWPSILGPSPSPSPSPSPANSPPAQAAVDGTALDAVDAIDAVDEGEVGAASEDDPSTRAGEQGHFMDAAEDVDSLPLPEQTDVPSLVTAGGRAPGGAPNLLRLRAAATGETIEAAPFDQNGFLVQNVFAGLSHLMRSRLTGNQHAIHPRLAEVLVRISRQWRDRYLRLHSGYREPGHGTRPTSYHTRGMAADIHVPGVPTRELFRVATEVGAFGVGVYPHDGFVHVDVRDIPHRWEQDRDGHEIALAHPHRWKLARRFPDLLAIGASPADRLPPLPHPGLPRECSGIRPADEGPFDNAIALTFDDGPSEQTGQILEVLRKHEAPATFFLTGENLDEYADEFAMIAAEPSVEIGNHAWKHTDLTALDLVGLEAQVERPTQWFSERDLDVPLFRFPYGRASCDATAWVHSRGYSVVGWHIDSADWCFDAGDGSCNDQKRFGHAVGHRDVIEHVRAQARRRKGGIALFHDIGLTAQVLDEMLTALEQDGYHFVPLSDQATFPKLQKHTARARARRLQLGTKRAATQLAAGHVERAWRIAAGGSTPPRTLTWPVEDAVATRAFDANGDSESEAIEVAHEAGSDVRSAADGIVGWVGDDLPGYGRSVIVIHPGGLVSVYGHNRQNLVGVGERVRRGQTIAMLGDEGIEHRPYLHFALLYDGQVCDPAPISRPLPTTPTGPIDGLQPVEWANAEQPPIRCAPRRAQSARL